jgi:hypothetical protein
MEEGHKQFLSKGCGVQMITLCVMTKSPEPVVDDDHSSYHTQKDILQVN